MATGEALLAQLSSLFQQDPLMYVLMGRFSVIFIYCMHPYSRLTRVIPSELPLVM
ncbi:hypothetical protein F441_17051, partial [Phytophthora nicotianae CJ01A1]